MSCNKPLFSYYLDLSHDYLTDEREKAFLPLARESPTSRRIIVYPDVIYDKGGSLSISTKYIRRSLSSHY